MLIITGNLVPTLQKVTTDLPIAQKLIGTCCRRVGRSTMIPEADLKVLRDVFNHTTRSFR